MVTINRIAKISILGSLLMGASALHSTTPITNVNKTPNQTEIVSKKSAEALRVLSLQGVQQASVPTEHNQKLDKALRKYIESDDDKQYIDNIINNTYKENGTFFGSVIMQHEINFQHLYAFLSGNTDILIKNNINTELGKTIKGFGDAFYKTVKPKEDQVANWVLNDYTPILIQNLQSNNRPTANDISAKLDDFAHFKAGFTKEELNEYYNYCYYFKNNKIKNNKDTQSMSDLIAYKTYMIDKILFKKELSGVGVFKAVGRFEKDGKTIRDYYDMWMKSIEPKAE